MNPVPLKKCSETGADVGGKKYPNRPFEKLMEGHRE